MTEPRIPQERLFKIARSKLLALGITNRISADGRKLGGEIPIVPPMEMFDPADKRPIKKITFVVEGHDHLKFTSPKALIGLPPQPFFDFNNLDDLVNDIKARLKPKTAVPEAEKPRPSESAPVTQKGIALEILTTALGKDAQMGPGSTIVKQLALKGKAVRFLTRFEQGDTFVARIDTQEGEAWKGHFSMETFPGVESFVAEVLGMEAPLEKIDPEPLGQGTVFTGEGIAGYQMPVVGEEWVMNILVEKEDEEETRYVGVDIDGQPYGAPRVLPTEAFLKTFVCVGKGVYQLLARVEEVTPEKVTYVRLDYNRQPVGKPVTTDLVAFLANFTAEAATY